MKIYVMSPYTGSRKEMEWRFTVATKYTAALIKGGNMAFSPITHSHLIAKYGGLSPVFEFWRDWNLSLIDLWADVGHLLKLPGWDISVGVSGEIDRFTDLDKAVHEINQEQYHEAIGGLA